MKIFNLFLVGLLSILLLSCGGAGNSNRQDIDKINAYGNLLGSEQIPYTVKTSDLQGKVRSLGVCPSMDKTLLSVALCEDNTLHINHTDEFGFRGTANNIDNFVANSGVQSITAYKISYNTPGQTSNFSGGSPTKEKVSGLILVPNYSVGQANIQGVVLYYHPTVLDKNSVPSAYFNLDDLKRYPTSLTAYNLATIFASQGYIVVAPDYVGQGDDYNVLHPYAVYPQVNALSGIYMLSALRQLNNSSIPDSSSQLNLYISSYSEGAPYALWASRLLQSEYAGILTKNNLVLKRTVGISGAYNLSGKQLPFAYAKVDSIGNAGGNVYNVSHGLAEANPLCILLGKDKCNIAVGLANFNMTASKIVLGSYAYTSFIHYNYSGTESFYNMLFKNTTSFLKMNKCLNLSRYFNPLDGALEIGSCSPYNGSTLEELFSNPNYTSDNISIQLVSSGMGSHNDFVSNYFTSGLPFNQVIANLYIGKPSNNSIGVIVNDLPTDALTEIKKADTYSFVTSSPITLVYMHYDSTVTNLSSKDAEVGIHSIGNVNLVNSVQIDNTKLYSVFSPSVQLPMYLEHGDAEFIANLVALAQIKKDESSSK